MSLKDMLSKGAGVVAGAVKSQTDEIKHYKERYEHYDDEYLKRKLRETTGTKKLAIAMILKERGYYEE